MLEVPFIVFKSALADPKMAVAVKERRVIEAAIKAESQIRARASQSLDLCTDDQIPCLFWVLKDGFGIAFRSEFEDAVLEQQIAFLDHSIRRRQKRQPASDGDFVIGGRRSPSRIPGRIEARN